MDKNDLFNEIEINIIDKNKLVTTKMITKDDIKNKNIKIDGFEYEIDSKYVFLYPTKNGYKPCIFYKYKNKEPIRFKDNNENIWARALHLLWNPSLYQVLVTPEGDKTNLILIILLLITIGTFAVKLYLIYG